MIRRIPSMRAFPLLVLGVCLPAIACGRGGRDALRDSPRASEMQLLERQVVSLRKALSDSKGGKLFPPDQLAVGVSEQVVQALILQALPIESPVGSQFHARIDRATVSLHGMQGAVKLEGRIWAVIDPSTFANLTLMGGIDGVEIERATGQLRAKIVIDGFDVTRAAAIGAEGEVVTEAARMLGRQGLGALRNLVPPLRIPVGIQQDLDISGISDGPIRFPAGRLSLEATVSRVLALSGRLWVMIDVATPGWSPLPAPAVPPRPASDAKKPKSSRLLVGLGVATLLSSACGAPSGDPPAIDYQKRIAELELERAAVREQLQATLTDAAKLVDAPERDILIGLPATLIERVIRQAINGPLKDVKLVLKNAVKVEKRDVVKGDTFFGTMTFGRYALNIDVHELTASMKPAVPRLTFGSDRIGIDMPVSVEQGDAKVTLYFEWDGNKLAGAVCGDMSIERDLHPTVPPFAVRVRGGFDLQTRGEDLIVKPVLMPVEMAFKVEPEKKDWDFVDAVLRSKNSICDAALRKAEVGQKLRDLLAQGFKLNMPDSWVKPFTLPISFRDTVDVQGRRTGLAVIPTDVTVTTTRVWYGANVEVQTLPASAKMVARPAGTAAKK